MLLIRGLLRAAVPPQSAARQRMNSKTETVSFKEHDIDHRTKRRCFLMTRVIETSIIHGRGAEDAIVG